MPWQLPRAEKDLLKLAKEYPFAAPKSSYIFRDGRAESLAAVAPKEIEQLFHRRTPVIAHGSNRSPDQLRRKYRDQATIPVTLAYLADYDVVYSAHVTQYGAIAANLQHHPGVTCALYVTWLDARQLDRMHETELGGENYHFGVMREIRLDLEFGPERCLSEAWVYLSTRGCLPRNGAPIALTAVPAEGERHQSLHQEEVQHHVRETFRPEHDLDNLILLNIREPEKRHALIDEMKRGAVPARAPNFSIIDSP
jgi:hypothetical protein